MAEKNEVLRKSLPMPLRVKNTILTSYEFALNYLDSYRSSWFSESFQKTYFRLFYSEVINLYSMLRVRISLVKKSSDYSVLLELEEYVNKVMTDDEITEDVIKKFVSYFSVLEKLLYDLGITETEVIIGGEKTGVLKT